MTAFLSSVVAKWWLRRFLELGGLIGVALKAWSELPPELQNTVILFLTAKWETITLGSLVPLVMAIGGYLWSFISTKRNQVVVDGQQVAMQEIPQKTAVEEIARTAIQKRSRTLVELLAEKLGRRS
jgi:hypothetical protein